MAKREKNEPTAKKYTVYQHTAPNGKIYIGITCQNVDKRWQRGRGYAKNDTFFSDICEIGWDNFKHEVIATGLTKEEACQKEKELIAKYKSNEEEHGYNKSTGGEKNAAGVKRSEATRKAMSKAKKGKKLCDEAYQNAREAKKALKVSGGKRYALEEILEHLDDIEKWAREGATEEQIAHCFGITRQTFYNYKRSHIDIFNAIKKGRTTLVEELHGVLARKAKGFQYTEKKIIREGGVVVREEIYEKASLPDVAALNLLLKNYDKEWANDPQMVRLREKELELKERQIEANEW